MRGNRVPLPFVCIGQGVIIFTAQLQSISLKPLLALEYISLSFLDFINFLLQLELDKAKKLWKEDSVDKLADEIRQIRVSLVYYMPKAEC